MQKGLNRGKTGLVPRTPTLASESYLDFLQTFRGKVAFAKGAEKKEIYNGYVTDRLNGRKVEDLELDEIVSTINELPHARVWQRFMRTHQEMFWRKTREAFTAHETEILAGLAESDMKGPGRLVADPDFIPPDYTRREIHLQPGGYTDDPIGGIVHHYGTKVFYSGMNDRNELHNEIADGVQLPDDGVVKRVIDLGCSLGQATFQLKRRFPDAEVWGLDVGLPMVRYAHQCGVEYGIDVNFIQALAEDTGFPDDHFDVVLLYILFHEVPADKAQEILAETFRIMRPGGRVTILEFPTGGKVLAPLQQFIVDYDSRNNCEPYSPGLVYSDFHGVIEAAGFVIEPAAANSNGFLQTLSAVKPA